MMTPSSYTYQTSYLSTMKNYTYGTSGGREVNKGVLTFDLEYSVLRVI
jgi:hypothetical protein